MPSTGTPASNTAGSTRGAPSSYTLYGEPLRMMPLGVQSRSAIFCVQGSISQYTLSSRQRRVMRCEYCEPKSRMSSESYCEWIASVSAGMLGEVRGGVGRGRGAVRRAAAAAAWPRRVPVGAAKNGLRQPREDRPETADSPSPPITPLSLFDWPASANSFGSV
jgi:hypothetical protein